MTLRNHRRWLFCATVLVVGAALALALYFRDDTPAPESKPDNQILLVAPPPGALPGVGVPLEVGIEPNIRTPPSAVPDQACEHSASSAQTDTGDLDTEQIEAHTRAWRTQLEGYAAALDASGNPEHAIIAANLSWNGPSDTRMQTLFDALAQSPHDGLLALTAFSQCKVNAHPACRPAQPEQLLIEADGDNGAAWQRVVVHFLAQGRDDAALDALRRVATASIYDTFTARSIAMANDALAAVTALPYAERVVLAMGAASATPIPNFSAMLNECRTRANQSGEWRQHCLAAGQRMERDAQDVLPKLVGIALQEAVYEGTGQIEEAHACRTRAQTLKKRVMQPARYSFDALAAKDAKVLERYLDEWAGNGELAAAEYAVVASKAAIAAGEHSACPDPFILERTYP